MKICTKCKLEFPLSEFVPRKDRNNKPHSWCNDCRTKNIKKVQAARKKKVDAVREIKSSRGCFVCGIKEPCVLDFHHIDPSVKDSTISNMFRNHCPMEQILEEISKCVVLCANHHRMLHEGLITL